MERRTLTIEATAGVLGVGTRTLYDHMTPAGIEIDEGRDILRVIRVGQRVLVPVPELERILGGTIEVAS